MQRSNQDSLAVPVRVLKTLPVSLWLKAQGLHCVTSAWCDRVGNCVRKSQKKGKVPLSVVGCGLLGGTQSKS